MSPTSSSVSDSRKPTGFINSCQAGPFVDYPLPQTAPREMSNFSNPHSYHLFAVPTPLLETLTPRNDISSRDLAPQPQPVAGGDGATKTEETTTTSTSTTSGRSCNVCQGASFANVDDQRNHFRSDWHRYNVKLRLNGKEVVAETQFTQLIEGLLTMLPQRAGY